MILGTKIRILSDFRLADAYFIRFSLIYYIKRYISLPLLTYTCARAYLYLRPYLPVPVSALTHTCVRVGRFFLFKSLFLRCCKVCPIWTLFEHFYLPSKLKVDDESIKLKGSFEAGYLRGIGLTSNVPLYLEVGGALQYRSYSEEDYGYETKFNMLSLNIPVALTYRINVTDDFAVSPNFGFDFRVNVMGKEKVTEDGDEFYDTDLFSDADWKRFQAGWRIGVGLDYRALHFGVQYGTDFNEIAEELKIATTSVTLGWNF